MSTEKERPASAEEEVCEEVEQEEVVEKETATEDQTETIAQLEAQIATLQEQLLRSQAEFDNFRKRTVKEKQDLTAFVKASCASPLIEVMDNFERALACECSDDTFKQGIEMLFSQFQASLKGLGVEEIDCVGKPFDPNFHNAVNQIQDDNFGDNTVAQVFQKGYQLGEKVVRHAMVVVANP